ncbi:MAG: Rieske 2Fe-2S domain-containing protein [Bradyrhizobium sp.]|nr:Rieske 2Fe-2S domain-containing protein [Bradyrhizobium sp.]
MGQLMRQYWIPACLPSELAHDGASLRLLLLGEKLIAFCDSAGRVGAVDHRCASLFLGRNEEHGLRCVYHGWKFDAEGNCVDMPSVPPPQDFKQKGRAKAYSVIERGRLVWAYMGAHAKASPTCAGNATSRGRRDAHPARPQFFASARGRHRYLACRVSSMPVTSTPTNRARITRSATRSRTARRVNSDSRSCRAKSKRSRC